MSYFELTSSDNKNANDRDLPLLKKVCTDEGVVFSSLRQACKDLGLDISNHSTKQDQISVDIPKSILEGEWFERGSLQREILSYTPELLACLYQEKETNNQEEYNYNHSADSLENARKSLQSNQSILNWFEQRGISKALLFHLQAGLTKDNQLIFPCSLTSWYSCRVTPVQVVDIELSSPTFCGEGLGVFGMKNAIKSLDKTVFIARSLLDALSIIETGNLAIFATEGKNDDLIEFCKANPGTSTYESYKNKLISLLYEAHPNFAKNQILSHNLTCVSISQIPQQYKSLNEILVADRSNFLTFLNAHKNAPKD